MHTYASTLADSKSLMFIIATYRLRPLITTYQQLLRMNMRENYHQGVKQDETAICDDRNKMEEKYG